MRKEIFLKWGCGGTAYTTDLKSVGESLRVQVPPSLPYFITSEVKKSWQVRRFRKL